MISLQTGSQVELGKTKIGSKVCRAWPGEKNKRLFSPQATLGSLGSPSLFRPGPLRRLFAGYDLLMYNVPLDQSWPRYSLCLSLLGLTGN